MLVLSRKIDEQIMIGDDIQITVVRLEGNRVGIGISAPRDIRILRGELAAKEAADAEETFELSDREQAFAHPQPPFRSAPKNRLLGKPQSQLFNGTVTVSGNDAQLNRAPVDALKKSPLSAFVNAS